MSNRDIIVKLRLAGEEFDRDFKIKFQDLSNVAEQSSVTAGTRAGGGFMKGFLGAAGLGALGAAIGNAISSAADLGSEIASTSRQFNIGAEELQVWRQAASNAGVTANDFNGSLASLTQKIGEANAGNRAAQQSFVDLGIGFKTTAGEARATDAVMLDLAQRIAEIEDPAKRVQLGTQLLGDEFKNLYPLLLDGADGFQRARLELGEFGAMLTQEEIRNLEKTNTKIEQMKNVLSIRVASVVAENADAILGLTNKLVDFAVAAVDATNAWLGMGSAFGGDFNRKVAALPANLDPVEKERRVQQLAAQAFRDRGQVVSDWGPFGKVRDTSKATLGTDDVTFYTPWHRAEVARWLAPLPPKVETPTLTGGTTRRGGGSRAARRPEKTEEEKAAEAALKAEERMRDAVARTLQEQRNSADLARIRDQLGEKAAAIAEAEFALIRQIPGIQAQTVEELGKALGYSEKMIETRRAELELQLATNKATLEGAKQAAGDRAQAEIDREAADQEKRNKDLADRQAEYWREQHRRAVLDVADIFETAMRGGVDDLWRGFKDQGLRMIAEVAAEWSLAMISGQPFSFNSAMGGAFGRSPISSIFFGAGGGFDATLGAAANDNGFPGFGGGTFRLGGLFGGNFMKGNGRGGDLLPSGADAGLIPNGAGGASSLLGQVGTAFALSQLGIAVGGNSGALGQIGGTIGGLAGSVLGPPGALIGSLLGNLLGGALTSQKRGSATVGGLGGSLGITGSRGNSSSRVDAASTSAGSLIDAIFQIADELGGSVNGARGAVSIGMRDNNWRVDTSGRGITKTKNGAIDFGSDQEAAIRFAIQDLIKDGVITGISQASQNLLQKGGDLEAQIEKALMIEAVPRLLKERLDPLGAALDELYDKFKDLADAMREGGASAEQIAEAQRLWELEKADAIASIGAASQTLQDFLASLNAGSNSPLSLREQRAEAERQLAPYLTQISEAEAARAEVERLRSSGASADEIAQAEAAARAAAAAIDQSGFTQASQLLLGISRQTNASSGAFFSDFDRIRALTGQAIGFVDQAAAREADNRDPFARETAQNTADTAAIVAEHTVILNNILAAINDNGLAFGTGSGFTRETRSFAL